MTFEDNSFVLSPSTSLSIAGPRFSVNSIDLGNRSIGAGERIYAEFIITIGPSPAGGVTSTFSLISSMQPLDSSSSSLWTYDVADVVSSTTLTYTLTSTARLLIPNGTRVQLFGLTGGGTDGENYYVVNSQAGPTSSTGVISIAASPGGNPLSVSTSLATVQPQYEYIASTGARSRSYFMGPTANRSGPTRIVLPVNPAIVQPGPFTGRYISAQLASSNSLNLTYSANLIISNNNGYQNYKSGFEIY